MKLKLERPDYNFRIAKNINSSDTFLKLSTQGKKLLFSMVYILFHSKDKYGFGYSTLDEIHQLYDVRIKEQDLAAYIKEVNSIQNQYIINQNGTNEISVHLNDGTAQMISVNLMDIYDTPNNSVLYMYLEMRKGCNYVPLNKLNNRVTEDTYNTFMKEHFPKYRCHKDDLRNILIFQRASNEDIIVRLPLALLLEPNLEGRGCIISLPTIQSEILYIIMWYNYFLHSNCLDYDTYKSFIPTVTPAEYNRIIIEHTNRWSEFTPFRFRGYHKNPLNDTLSLDFQVYNENYVQYLLNKNQWIEINPKEYFNIKAKHVRWLYLLVHSTAFPFDKVVKCPPELFSMNLDLGKNSTKKRLLEVIQSYNINVTGEKLVLTGVDSDKKNNNKIISYNIMRQKC